MISRLSGYAVHFKIQPVDIPALFGLAEIKVSPVVDQQLIAECCLIVLKCVWPAMEPDKLQGIGRMVCVSDRFKSIECMLLVIQAHGNLRIHPLLPVL